MPKPEDTGKPADKGRDFAPGRMEGGGKANAPGQNKEDRERPDKPGQQKMKTVSNPTTGEQRILSKAEIKAQKAALIAAGFKGPGLDADDDDTDDDVVPPAGGAL